MLKQKIAGWKENIKKWFKATFALIIFALIFYLIFSSRPAFGKSAVTRWRWSSQTARGSWLCPGRRCSAWTRRASVRWRTWPTSPASTRPLCCTTSESDTTRAWSTWVHECCSVTFTPDALEPSRIDCNRCDQRGAVRSRLIEMLGVVTGMSSVSVL